MFHEDRKSEINAKAHDVVEAARSSVRVLAPGFSGQDCLYTNRAIRAALVHEATGLTYRFARGVREFAPNAERRTAGIPQSNLCPSLLPGPTQGTRR